MVRKMRELCHLNNKNLFRLLVVALLLILAYIIFNTVNLVYEQEEEMFTIDPVHSDALSRPDDYFVEYDPKHSNLTFDEHCDQHGEWSSIGNTTYIKKTGVFFFTDMGLLRAHVLRRGDKQLTYSVNLTIYRRVKLKDSPRQVSFKLIKSIYKPDTNKWHSGSSSKYFYEVLSVRVDLSNLTDIRSLRMVAVFKEKETNRITNHPVNVKIKSVEYSNYASRKGTLVCSKVCLIVCSGMFDRLFDRIV
jgi:hypothetical protein